MATRVENAGESSIPAEADVCSDHRQNTQETTQFDESRPGTPVMM